MLKMFTDTETTGLDETVHAIHQIAAVILDENDKLVDKCNIKWCPPLDNMSEEALNKTRMSKELFLARNKTEAEGCAEFIAFCDKHVNKFDKNDKMQYIAFNAPFDEKFTRALFKRHGHYFRSYFWTPTVCIQRAIAFMVMDSRDKFERFGLSALCLHAGIKFDESVAHDAMYDAAKTVELYLRLK